MAKKKLNKKELKANLKKRMKETSARVASADSGSGGIFKADDVNFFKSKEGQHVVRIVPYIAGKNSPLDESGKPKNKEGEDAYIMEFWQHPNVGIENKGKVLCLQKNFGKKCPICEHRAKLIANDGDEEEIKALKPKLRAAYNVVCYKPDEEDKGCQVWSLSHWYSEKRFQKLAKKVVKKGKTAGDPYKYYMSPFDDGYDIVFTQEGKDEKYDITGISFDSSDCELDDEILDSAYCLEDLLNIPKYADVFNLYWGEFLEDENEEESEEESEEENESEIEEEEQETEEEEIESEEEQETEEESEEETEEEETPAEKKKREKAEKKAKKDKKKKVKDENPCPEGCKFGYDWAEEDKGCTDEKCPMYDECEAEYDKLNEAGKV